MTPRVLAQVGDLGPAEAHFVRLIDVELSPLLAAGAVLAALAVGAVHALAPGHGKAIIAAYLVGQRGRPRDALALGTVVALMHSLSVIVLGTALFLITRVPAGADRLAPWLTLASGVLVLAVGVGLVVRHLRRRRVLARVPAGRAHDHSHPLPPEVPPLSRRGLVLLGMSGGLLPSPSAFLVLATAIFTGRALFGLGLVVAFSVGLAATLTIMGLAVLRGREAFERRALRDERLARVGAALPLASAVLVLLGGGYLTVLALVRL